MRLDGSGSQAAPVCGGCSPAREGGGGGPKPCPFCLGSQDGRQGKEETRPLTGQPGHAEKNEHSLGRLPLGRLLGRGP